MDIAWAKIVDDVPAMADSGKYQTVMYEAFWNGNFPSTGTDSKGEKISRAPTPMQAHDDLAALMAEAKRLRGETDE